MSTTSKKEEIPEWGKWGDGKTNPDLKTYIELLIKYNNQQKEILKDTKEWLLNINGNQQR
jgi:hypothetical protein